MRVSKLSGRTSRPGDASELQAQQAALVGYFAAICMLIAARPARAQNRGVYPLGMSAINSGVTPESGFTYSNQLLFMRAIRPRTMKAKRFP